jgi:hypothetical protein
LRVRDLALATCAVCAARNLAAFRLVARFDFAIAGTYAVIVVTIVVFLTFRPDPYLP